MAFSDYYRSTYFKLLGLGLGLAAVPGCQFTQDLSNKLQIFPDTKRQKIEKEIKSLHNVRNIVKREYIEAQFEEFEKLIKNKPKEELIELCEANNDYLRFLRPEQAQEVNLELLKRNPDKKKYIVFRLAHSHNKAFNDDYRFRDNPNILALTYTIDKEERLIDIWKDLGKHANGLVIGYQFDMHGESLGTTFGYPKEGSYKYDPKEKTHKYKYPEDSRLTVDKDWDLVINPENIGNLQKASSGLDSNSQLAIILNACKIDQRNDEDTLTFTDFIEKLSHKLLERLNIKDIVITAANDTTRSGATEIKFNENCEPISFTTQDINNNLLRYDLTKHTTNNYDIASIRVIKKNQLSKEAKANLDTKFTNIKKEFDKALKLNDFKKAENQLREFTNVLSYATNDDAYTSIKLNEYFKLASEYSKSKPSSKDSIEALFNIFKMDMSYTNADDRLGLSRLGVTSKSLLLKKLMPKLKDILGDLVKSSKNCGPSSSDLKEYIERSKDSFNIAKELFQNCTAYLNKQEQKELYKIYSQASREYINNYNLIASLDSELINLYKLIEDEIYLIAQMQIAPSSYTKHLAKIFSIINTVTIPSKSSINFGRLLDLPIKLGVKVQGYAEYVLLNIIRKNKLGYNKINTQESIQITQNAHK